MGSSSKVDRGLLVPPRESTPFRLERHAPSADLTEIIDRFWIVSWDLGDSPPVEQETLPFPCVNMVIGDHQPGVHGPLTRRFVAHLEGRGSVIGTKLRPAGFRGMSARRPIDLLDHTYTMRAMFGGEGASLEHDVLALRDSAQSPRPSIERIESFVRVRHQGIDADDRAANEIIAVAANDTSITRVADLAERAGLQVRALERLLRSRVGVTPKWVIRRFRVQEAAMRLAEGGAVDLSGLAADLGYFDQPHFIRDFKSQIGKAPAEYAKLCAARA